MIAITKGLKRYKPIKDIHDSLRYLYNRYFISDLDFVKWKFKKRMNREVDLINPVRYTDKLQWLKLYWHSPLAARCADKYEVRQHIETRLGREYLNEIYGVYENVEEINFDTLPDAFVLKATHGSGWNIICRDKKQLDWSDARKKLKKWLQSNYYWNNREWVYKELKPRIICEKYLSDEEGNPPKDYKILCFNGEPKVINVDIDRFINHRRNFYDLNWNLLNVQMRNPNDLHYSLPRPVCFDRMLEICKILSRDFPHVRVDFYYVDKKIIIGELTFFNGSGMTIFTPEEYDYVLGDWLNLPECREKTL